MLTNEFVLAIFTYVLPLFLPEVDPLYLEYLYSLSFDGQFHGETTKLCTKYPSDIR